MYRQYIQINNADSNNTRMIFVTDQKHPHMNLPDSYVRTSAGKMSGHF